MNDLMQNEISVILEKAQNNVDQAVDFVVTQTPLLANEIISWGLWSSIYLGIFGLLALTIGVLQHNKRNWKLFNNGDELGWARLTAGSMIGFIGLIVLIIQVYDIIKVTVAPRVFMIEYFTYLIQQN